MHPFFDGNKRTGFTLADVILRSYGLEIHTGKKRSLASCCRWPATSLM